MTTATEARMCSAAINKYDKQMKAKGKFPEHGYLLPMNTRGNFAKYRRDVGNFFSHFVRGGWGELRRHNSCGNGPAANYKLAEHLALHPRYYETWIKLFSDFNKRISEINIEARTQFKELKSSAEISPVAFLSFCAIIIERDEDMALMFIDEVLMSYEKGYRVKQTPVLTQSISAMCENRLFSKNHSKTGKRTVRKGHVQRDALRDMWIAFYEEDGGDFDAHVAKYRKAMTAIANESLKIEFPEEPVVVKMPQKATNTAFLVVENDKLETLLEARNLINDRIVQLVADAASISK